jgi:hypothetical protein
MKARPPILARGLSAYRAQAMRQRKNRPAVSAALVLFNFIVWTFALFLLLRAVFGE